MIQLNDVKKEYAKFQLDVTLNVPTGRITGLIGKNGAGKSTTFKAILGLIKPDSGSINIFNKNITEITSNDKMNIGVVLSDSGFSNYLSINDIIPVLSSFYSTFDREYFDNLIHKFQLPIDKKLKDFSTGMKAKLKLIVAISHYPELLILDEPTAGLDVTAREELLDILRDYMIENENRSILISSHISSDLESLCDDIYMIDEGKIILHEETDLLLSNYAILKIDNDILKDINLDTNYLLRQQKDTYSTSYLTNQKQFYTENYPEIIIDKVDIDEVIKLMLKGDLL